MVLTSLLVRLDHALTSRSPASTSSARTLTEEDLVWGGASSVMYLSDGGYSRVHLGEDGRLVLDRSLSTPQVIEAWDQTRDIRDRIEAHLREWAVSQGMDPQEDLGWESNPTDEHQVFVEVQSDLFQGSGANASTDFDEKIPGLVRYFERRGWDDIPPLRAKISILTRGDVDDYLDAAEGGYEHELDYSRPLSYADIGVKYAQIYDGHNRAWAARDVGIPLRVRL